MDTFEKTSAVIAAIATVYTYLASRQAEVYASFDEAYMKILDYGLQYPKFRDKNLTGEYRKHFHGDDLLKYQIYALMCWNFCETIYDSNKDLPSPWKWRNFRTWKVVIDAENILHRTWFDEPENQTNHKESFRKYIKENYINK